MCIRDSYFADNGFAKACLGISGGIDSAMTLVIAAEALGAENVTAISMPSRYSSDHSVSDSQDLCDNLGVTMTTLGIEATHMATEETFDAESSTLDGLAAQNLQSRIRGLFLMAYANQHGRLVVGPGNKSEVAVGYSTLYGDTVGAYAVIADVWKTQLYELADWYLSLIHI